MLRHQQTTQRDRSLEELDKAIAATEATSKKAAKLVQDKEARAKAAQTRKVKLLALLNVVCDDCATIPCLLRADHNTKPTSPASFQSVQTCIVCGNSTDRLVVALSRHGVPAVRKGGDAPTASQLESELASHIGKTSPSATAWNHALHQTKVALNAPTRQQMLKKADEFVTAADLQVDRARKVKSACDQQKQALKKEQEQLLARLGGLTGAKRKASAETCAVCLAATKTHVLIPCGHKCVCDQCARGYRAGSQCPICRSRVQSVVRVFD